MPLGMGETIGAAFVRILADGSGLAKSVQDEFKKTEEPIKAAGKRSGEKYKDGLDEELKRLEPFTKNLNDELDKASGIFHARGQAMGKDFQQNISDGVTNMLAGSDLDKNAREIGDRVAHNMAVGINEGRPLGTLNEQIIKAGKDIQKDVSAALAQGERDRLKISREGEAAIGAVRKRFADQETYRQNFARDLFRLNAKVQQESEAKTAKLERERAKIFRDISAGAARVAANIERQRVATERHTQSMGRLQTIAQKMNEDFDKGRAHIGRVRAETERAFGSLSKMQSAALKLNSAFDRGFLTSKQMAENFGRLPNNMRKSANAAHVMANEFDRIAGGLGKAFGEGSRNNFLNIVGKTVGGLAKIPGVAIKGGDAIGRGLLKGGAKAIELIGQGLTKVGGWIADIGGKFGDFFTKIGEGLQKTGSDLAAFGQKAGESLGKVGQAAAAGGEELAATGPGGMIAGAVAIAAALLALPVVIGTVVSAFSVLVAAATALVSSLAFAVVGAVAPLAGLLLPLVAVVGVVMLAINKLSAVNKANNKSVADAQKHVDTYRKALENAKPGTDAYARAQKNLKGAIETQAKAQAKAGDTLGAAVTRIKGAFDDLRTAAAEGLFGGKGGGAALSGLSGALHKMIPIVGVVAKAVQDVGVSFGKGLQSKQFNDFLATLKVNLPGQIRAIGAIIKSTFGGLAGVFTALMPSTNTFAKNVQGAADNFNKWANGPGQAKLRKFFDDARISAGKVWDLIKALAIDLGKILSPGKKSGDSIIDSLTGSLKDFGDWLDAHPNSIKDWFKAGEDAAKAVGGVVKDIIAFIKKMDTPENRKHAIAVFKSIGEVVNDFLIALEVLKFAWKGLVMFFKTNPGFIILYYSAKTLITAVTAIVKFFQDLPQQAQNAWDRVKAAWAAVTAFFKDVGQKIIDGLQAAWDWIKGPFLDFINSIPGLLLTGLGELTGIIFNALYNGFNNAINWITNTALPWISALPSKIRTFFIGAPAFLKDFFVNAWNALVAWWSGSFLPWVRALPGRIRSGFTGSVTFIKDFFVRAWSTVTSWWTSTAWPWIKSLPQKIMSAFTGINSSIGNGILNGLKAAVNSVIDDLNKFIKGFNAKSPKDIPLIPRWAAGGLVDRATLLVAGEAGTEAIVPLNRPLAMVDPAVRQLSAFAQGKPMTATDMVASGKVINVGGLTVITPTADPFAVAQETVNKLVGASYI